MQQVAERNRKCGEHSSGAKPLQSTRKSEAIDPLFLPIPAAHRLRLVNASAGKVGGDFGAIGDLPGEDLHAPASGLVGCLFLRAYLFVDANFRKGFSPTLPTRLAAGFFVAVVLPERLFGGDRRQD